MWRPRPQGPRRGHPPGAERGQGGVDGKCTSARAQDAPAEGAPSPPCKILNPLHCTVQHCATQERELQEDTFEASVKVGACGQACGRARAHVHARHRPGPLGGTHSASLCTKRCVGNGRLMPLRAAPLQACVRQWLLPSGRAERPRGLPVWPGPARGLWRPAHRAAERDPEVGSTGPPAAAATSVQCRQGAQIRKAANLACPPAPPLPGTLRASTAWMGARRRTTS